MFKTFFWLFKTRSPSCFFPYTVSCLTTRWPSVIAYYTQSRCWNSWCKQNSWGSLISTKLLGFDSGCHMKNDTWPKLLGVQLPCIAIYQNDTQPKWLGVWLPWLICSLKKWHIAYIAGGWTPLAWLSTTETEQCTTKVAGGLTPIAYLSPENQNDTHMTEQSFCQNQMSPCSSQLFLFLLSCYLTSLAVIHHQKMCWWSTFASNICSTEFSMGNNVVESSSNKNVFARACLIWFYTIKNSMYQTPIKMIWMLCPRISIFPH